MSSMIASDDANPDYVGQKNPDASLSVMFYSKPLKNNFESEKQGRPIFDDADMVKIFLPGDDKNVIDTFAREDHKARFPRQWAHYQNKLAGDQRLVGKTPIDQWPRITPAMAEELRAIKFLAVDDVANASDLQIQSLGMIAGMSPHAFRDAARNFLRVAGSEAAETKTTEALAAVTAENEAMRAQMATMMARLEALSAAQPAAAAPDGLAGLAAANPVVEPAPAKRKEK